MCKIRRPKTIDLRVVFPWKGNEYSLEEFKPGALEGRVTKKDINRVFHRLQGVSNFVPKYEWGWDSEGCKQWYGWYKKRWEKLKKSCIKSGKPFETKDQRICKKCLWITLLTLIYLGILMILWVMDLLVLSFIVVMPITLICSLSVLAYRIWVMKKKWDEKWETKTKARSREIKAVLSKVNEQWSSSGLKWVVDEKAAAWIYLEVDSSVDTPVPPPPIPMNQPRTPAQPRNPPAQSAGRTRMLPDLFPRSDLRNHIGYAVPARPGARGGQGAEENDPMFQNVMVPYQPPNPWMAKAEGGMNYPSMNAKDNLF